MNLISLRKNVNELFDMGLWSKGLPGERIGNAGCARLDDIFLGCILGDERKYNPYTEKYVKDVEKAIADGEIFGQSVIFHTARLCLYRALGMWFLTGQNNESFWGQTADCLKQAAATPGVYTPSLLKTAYLDDYIAYCFLAKRFDAGKSAYEQAHPGKAVSVAKGTPKEYAYSLCLNALGEWSGKENAILSGRRVLRSNLVRNWLGRGQISRTALWANLVYSEVGGERSAVNALLAIYDDMPNVEKPF